MLFSIKMTPGQKLIFPICIVQIYAVSIIYLFNVYNFIVFLYVMVFFSFLLVYNITLLS